MEDLSGKVGIVTGGSKGIGYGIAEALVKEGMNVAITARHEDEVKKSAEKLNDIGPGKALGISSNVRKLEDEQNVVSEVLNQWGQIDLLMANAGVGKFAPIDEMSPEEWTQTIETNLTGVFHSIKAAVEPLKASKGYFMTLASLAGTNFFEKGAAYNASKFGLVGFTQAVMLDLRKYGVKTTTIMPGSVASYFNQNTPSADDEWKIQPEDIGDMVVYLLKTPHRSLPSKIEVRPTMPPSVKG